ncbi:hypothetical protein CBL_11256 [Carabus blaptoides fortunei]
MSQNTNKNKPATVVGMVRQPNSARKPLNSARKPLVVRQTLTSKLRAERADQVTFYKAKLQELANQTLTRTASKESVKSLTSSVFKTPMPKVPAQLPNGRAKMNLTAAFQTPAQKNVKTSATDEKKRVVNTTIVEQKRNISNVKMAALVKREKDNKTPSENNIANSVRDKTTTISSKYMNTSTKNSSVQNNVPKSAEFTNCKNFSSQNIQSAKTTRTDPTKKPVQYRSALAKPRGPLVKPPATAVVKKLNLLVEKRKVTIISPMRKSLTAMHMKRTTNQNRNSTIHRAQSLGKLAANQSAPSGPITVQETGEMIFKTPSLAKRRSTCKDTPMSSAKNVCSPYHSDSVDLRRRLSLWLKQKDKPVGAYHHLRCFGLHTLAEPQDEENKENIEVAVKDIHSSYTELSIEPGNVDPLHVVNEAMFDLQQLIQEGYPRVQCEAWLDVISSHYGEVEHQPQYWECRAALEEARGDFTTAVDCYKRAIIKGAEVRVVDASLENLLQKFSVLNITPTKTIGDQRRSSLEVKNVFKSSIINFAIQERSKKSDGDGDTSKFIATPVRRSTRASRSGYTSTRGVTICTSLKQLDSPIRNSLQFKANKALH